MKTALYMSLHLTLMNFFSIAVSAKMTVFNKIEAIDMLRRLMKLKARRY